jgi:flagellar basal-body rod protein FlgF
MDKMVYVAMTGAKQILQAQAVNNHNIANVSTHGFRADLHRFATQAVAGPGFASRANAVTESTGFDLTTGTLLETGRDLDVAVAGEGWIAVQAADGSEAYTRAGNLRVSATGVLETAAGHPVLGDGGPISVPPSNEIAIGRDGTVSIVPQGLGPSTLASIGRIKLVNPAAETLVKGADGLIRTDEGGDAPADAGVQLISGVLESSNVNAPRALIGMIEMARLFDLQVKAMNTAEQTANAATKMISLV